jgi:predicted Zn-dependent protease
VTGRPQRQQINGLPAVTGSFTAQTQSGQTVAGAAAFISHGGLVYEIIGMATQAGWSQHQTAITATLRSFAPLTDPAILAVQPFRLDVIRVDRDATLTDFARRYPGPVSVSALAVMNNVDSTATLPRNSFAKRVVGKPLP